MCDDVRDFEITGLRAEGDRQAECLIRLRQTRQAFIHGCRCLSDMPTFLRVEGKDSREIMLLGNDLHHAVNAFESAEDVSQRAVILGHHQP